MAFPLINAQFPNRRLPMRRVGDEIHHLCFALHDNFHPQHPPTIQMLAGSHRPFRRHEHVAHAPFIVQTQKLIAFRGRWRLMYDAHPMTVTRWPPSNAIVRQAAAQALGHLNVPRAVEPLLAALRDKKDAVRQAAARALGRLRDPRAVEPLRAALQDESLEVREVAMEVVWQHNNQ